MSALITSGQRKQLKRLFEDGAEWAIEIVAKELTQDEAQRVLGRGNELRAGFPELIRNLARGRFVYHPDHKVHSFTKQLSRLHELFPSLCSANEKLAKQPLPAGAEGIFAIPRWQKLAPSYNEAVELVLKKIAETRRFHNYRAGYLGEQYLRQHQRTAKMFETLAQQQPDYDVLVIPGQFGLKHCGLSVGRAREVFTANEVGFGAFALGIMLLTHPEPLVSYDNGWIDCPGDECGSALGPVGNFSEAPFFVFDGGRIRLDTRYVHSPSGSYGCASGFLV